MSTRPEGSYETLLVSRSGPIREITLHRPEQRNSINQTLLAELERALDEAEQDPQNRVIVLSGEGSVFCTGMDFEAAVKAPAGATSGLDGAPFMALLKRLSRIARVVIAKVEGTTLAGGVGLVAASDFVYAGPKATFSLSEALWGLLPAVVTPFLIRRVGFQKAYAMTLTTRAYPASEALAMGLVDALSEDLDQEIKANARRMARLDPRTITDMKAYFRDMWILTEATEQRAVAELERLMLEPRVQKNIREYVELGKLPWEQW